MVSTESLSKNEYKFYFDVQKCYAKSQKVEQIDYVKCNKAQLNHYFQELFFVPHLILYVESRIISSQLRYLTSI